ncbi:methyltransferase family protein [Neolewinella xylanilytica]|uniref:Methyltransferase family protein n=1 Tax=Neolewinella xylanilytica TaxID=1514080 RepID=A0A2S6I8L2_9BACT|nr:class I SAM-dependent methyltransferase [Neolewinella xylanilytica]PPK87822.1 methyltransferase family protein [Neolewinella xylanilytica]
MFDLSSLLRDAYRPPEPYLTPEGVYNFLPDDPEAGNYVEHYHLDALESDYFAPVEDGATRHESDRLHQEILRHLPAETRTVLDVGCGSAWVARELLPRVDAVISFDIAIRNSTEAIKRYPAPHHVAVTGDAFDLPFRDASLDAVISSEVMEHVPDVAAYLRSLLRVVRPGGRLILSTPYAEKIQYSLCIHCNRPTPLHAHLHSFNERVIASLLAPLPGIDYRTYTLSNKALLVLRTHPILRHLPFRAWRSVDALANRVVKKPSRLVIVVDKLV